VWCGPVKVVRSPRLLLFAAVVYALSGARHTRADVLRPRKVSLRVGEAMEFSVAPAGASGVWEWSLDGRAAATGRTWTFAPGPEAVGTHRVQVVASGPGGRRVQRWAVRVRALSPPRIASAAPASATIELPAGDSADLVIHPAPDASGGAPSVEWSLDGTRAGDGERLRVTGTHAGTMRARAVVTNALGVAVAREWRIVVSPPPTVVAALPLQPSTTVAPPPKTTTTVASVPVPSTTTTRATVPPLVPTTTAPPVVALRTEPPPAPRAASTPEIRSFLERYASAWRARDVEALAAIGQVTNERQADALRRYFEGVRDFDVDVTLIDVRTEGDRAIVRFTRRDRFRNPGGEMVSKESPPIEKEVVRTSSGLRFAAPAP